MSKSKTNSGNGTVDSRRQEVQRIVKNACDQLNSEGVDARNYVEQLAWLFFLKAFDEAETRREEEAAFDDAGYERRLSGDFAWSSWASKTDHPDEMLEFVDGKLWIKLTSPDPKKGLGDDPLAERFRRVFDNVRNYSRRGASFARVVAQVDKLHFSSDTDVHVLSEIYEDLLKRVAADSAGYAGEFYTQRHVIRAMVEVVKPQIGDKVYDPCFGTCGFLGEAADYMSDPQRNPKAKQLSGRDLEKLQSKTFFGLEIKPLTYLLGTMNMILHGIESANLELGNTLEVHSDNISEKDRYEVVFSNPPYGGKMASELQTNFRVRSRATECLFLQHIMRSLAKGGRAAVIVPEGVLYRGGPDQKVRQELLEHFNVHTILSLPAGCFLPYTGVKTNVLFFNRPSREVKPGEFATKSVWYYELVNDGFELKQTRRPIEGSQFPDFLSKQSKHANGDNSWSVDVSEIVENNFELSAKNPRLVEELVHRSATVQIQTFKAVEQRTIELLDELEQRMSDSSERQSEDAVWDSKRLGDIAEVYSGVGFPKARQGRKTGKYPFAKVGDISKAVREGGMAIASAGNYVEDEDVKALRGRVFPEGTIVFAKIGEAIRKNYRALTEVPMLLDNNASGVIPQLEIVDPVFLLYYLRTLDFYELAVSAVVPSIRKSTLVEIEVPLPSLPEQVRVVEEINECMDRIEEIERLKRSILATPIHLGSLRSAILRKAFAGEL